MDPRKQTPMKVPHEQEPPQSRRRPPVLIRTILPDKIIHVHRDDFKPLVQNLTGKPSTVVDDESRGGSLSPDSWFVAMENANRAIEQPDSFFPVPTTLPQGMLSPGPSFFPSSMTPDDLFPVPTNFPQDGYWNQQRQYQPPIPHGGPPKRPRPDFGHDMESYLSRDEDRGGITHSVKDARTIGSAYDLYLQSVQTPSEEVGPFNGVSMGRPGGGNNMMPSPSMGDLMTVRDGILGPNGRDMGFGQQDLVGRPSRELLRLPPDASNTLYVEGLPSNCSRREVAHIFRPFLGYREVRLVTKDSKQRNGDPVVLCFVDFENPACAATARTALQGYRMDEVEPDSKILQIQFSRNPGPRPGQRGGRR